MTREEEREYAARNDCKQIYTNPVLQGIYKCGHKDGSNWADEHPKNPWRDAKKDPPKDTKTVVAIFKKYSIFEKWLCSYSPEEKIWDMSNIICDPPDYWMPIPELPSAISTTTPNC